jgi:transglutaminase-like putative cysteine protease
MARCFFLALFLLGVQLTPIPVAAHQASDIPATPQNLGLEEGELGKAPTHWIIPQACLDAGYSVALSDSKPFAGKRSAVLRGNNVNKEVGFGTLMQAIDATKYRGKRIRFKAAVRTEVAGAGNQAMLWLRVDTEKGSGFFDNMAERPITANDWKHYEIVGDVAKDATALNFGLILTGEGIAALDDVSLEIVDPATKITGASQTLTAAPGLTEVVMAATVHATEKAQTATFVYPLPLAYRDQVPLTFRLTVDPPTAAAAVEIVPGSGPNRLLKLTLKDLGTHRKVAIEYRSLVLVAPTSFADVPKIVPFPASWPAEAQPWLASTWCVEHNHERIQKIAKEIRGEKDDVMVVIAKTLARAQHIFAGAKGHVGSLTAVEALEKQGSCTSCANLVAALLRGAGVPARVLAGYPLWSGPLQTHYIVEAYVPGYGWYPVESTMGKSAWPNHQQVNVNIVAVEQESKAVAGPRSCAAGGVPQYTVTEYEGDTKHFHAVGTLKPYCDHACRMIRPMTASATEWEAAKAWTNQRWSAWLQAKPSLKEGQLLFGPATDQVSAKTLAELQVEIK